MKPSTGLLLKFALLILIWFVWWWAYITTLSDLLNLSIIVIGVLLIFPLVWLGRQVLERHLSAGGVAWTTTFVHVGVGLLLGIPLIRAVITYQEWSGWVLPVPPQIGLALVLVSGGAFVLVVANLALKGSGAPFYIALSQKLAVDWLYGWTRNPMVLATLAFFLSLGLWFQSAAFVLWVVILVTPALLYFVKVYEERELELRFGNSYLQYRSKTPFLFPRRPKG